MPAASANPTVDHIVAAVAGATSMSPRSVPRLTQDRSATATRVLSRFGSVPSTAARRNRARVEVKPEAAAGA
jgi:hypothetical protein